MPWVFVYGTLMRGMPNHHLIEGYVLQCLKATTTGKLYHLPEGYPVLVPEGYEQVYGEALKIYDDSPALGILDDLEDFFGPGRPENRYERIQREVYLPNLAWKVQAIVYVCPEDKKEQVKKEGKLVAEGDWKKFIQKEMEKS